MTDFEIRQVPEQHIAATRHSCSMDDIGETMAQAFPQIFETVTTAGAVPAGPPLGRYFSFGGPVIDFECAIPVAAPFVGEGDVQPGTIGGGEAAFTTHVGPYDNIGATWEAMMEWLKDQGRAPAGPGWESYLTDPSAEPDSAKWLTEVVVPLG